MKEEQRDLARPVSSNEIPSLLEELGMVIGNLEQNVDILSETLTPIKRNEPTSDSNDADRGTSTKLGDTLLGMVNRIQRINVVILDDQDKLEI